MVEHYSIDLLPVKTYPRGRKMWRIPGEKAALRWFDPHDAIDMKRLREIDRDSEVNKWMAYPGEGDTPDDKLKMLVENKSTILRFAVVKSEGEADEIGEVQGWVRFDQNPQRIAKVNQVDPYLLQGKKLIDVTFARYPKSNPGEGLISSALRQMSLFVLAEWEFLKSKTGEDTDNLSPIDMAVIAYVEPDNVVSKRVLEKAGFTKKLDNIVYSEEEPRPNELWLLDWDKVHKIAHSKSDSALFSDFNS